MFWSIAVLAAVGIGAGFITSALLRGPGSLSVLRTLTLGIAGSFTGGAVGYALLGSDIGDRLVQTTGLIGSIMGSIVALVAYLVFVQERQAFI